VSILLSQNEERKKEREEFRQCRQKLEEEKESQRAKRHEEKLAGPKAWSRQCVIWAAVLLRNAERGRLTVTPNRANDHFGLKECETCSV